MKIDRIEIKRDDIVMIHHCIGNMAPKEVDAYCKKFVNDLGKIFGNGRVMLFPVREGPAWDFTIITRPPDEIKKVAKSDKM